jgi:hypothetical protein
MNPKYPQEWLEQIPAEVFGCLLPGELRIVILPGSGPLNGGALRDIPIETVPHELRMPNTRLWLQLDENLKIVRVWRRDE